MKKFVLGISSFVVVFLLIIIADINVDIGVRDQLYKLDYLDRRFVFNIIDALWFFPFIFLFSLITYKLPERIFRAWWKFARIAIPLILILSIYINLGLHHSPVGMWQDILDIPMLIGLYTIFTLGSLIQIYRGWRKKEKKK